MQIFSRLARLILGPTLGHAYKLMNEPAYRGFYFQALKLCRIPRYQQVRTRVLGYDLTLVDTDSFLSNFHTIFVQQVYLFRSATDRPVILDCGANIGLSVLYFKRLFPQATIVAFEPDPVIFGILQQNLVRNGIFDVSLVDKAVWDKDAIVEFAVEGADAGRVALVNDAYSRIDVSTVRLRDYLDSPVDLLKIDIEGAEVKVITDCADRLVNVCKLFVEYHSFENQSQELSGILSTLESAGFRFHIHCVNPSPSPFVHRTVICGMDLQLNIFAWRD